MAGNVNDQPRKKSRIKVAQQATRERRAQEKRDAFESALADGSLRVYRVREMNARQRRRLQQRYPKLNIQELA